MREGMTALCACIGMLVCAAIAVAAAYWAADAIVVEDFPEVHGTVVETSTGTGGWFSSKHTLTLDTDDGGRESWGVKQYVIDACHTGQQVHRAINGDITCTDSEAS